MHCAARRDVLARVPLDPWSSERNWHPNIVQGRTERTSASVSMLMSAIHADHAAPPAELVTPAFELVNADERAWALRGQVAREGQGTFRLRLLQAYGRCAITGEHTHLVLDGAHISPTWAPAATTRRTGSCSPRNSTRCSTQAT